MDPKPGMAQQHEVIKMSLKEWKKEVAQEKREVKAIRREMEAKRKGDGWKNPTPEDKLVDELDGDVRCAAENLVYEVQEMINDLVKGFAAEYGDAHTKLGVSNEGLRILLANALADNLAGCGEVKIHDLYVTLGCAKGLQRFKDQVAQREAENALYYKKHEVVPVEQGYELRLVK